jgi:hypothetical protein
MDCSAIEDTDELAKSGANVAKTIARVFVVVANSLRMAISWDALPKLQQNRRFQNGLEAQDSRPETEG